LFKRRPFMISPDHGILPIGENMQVTLDFQPTKVGDYKSDLIINYDSSESIFVSLYGAAQDVNVRLEKNSIRLEDTFITMSNQRTVTIHNRSNIIVHYIWKKFATFEEEEQQKLKEITMLSREEENTKQKIMANNNLAQQSDLEALLSRNFQNKVKTTQSKGYTFEDNVFFIQPIEGDIWPMSSVDVQVIFKPDYDQTYNNRTAFCEVTGRESRLPLRLSGVGIGPKIQLSIEKLDAGCIFIGSTHTYEVFMANKGFIDAIYSVNIPKTKFGKYFNFDPNEGLISPNGYQSINVTFRSDILGDFEETFEFTIDGKPDKYKLEIRYYFVLE
jgi:hydrocephalus-inducing protein